GPGGGRAASGSAMRGCTVLHYNCCTRHRAGAPVAGRRPPAASRPARRRARPAKRAAIGGPGSTAYTGPAPAPARTAGPASVCVRISWAVLLLFQAVAYTEHRADLVFPAQFAAQPGDAQIQRAGVKGFVVAPQAFIQHFPV